MKISISFTNPFEITKRSILIFCIGIIVGIISSFIQVYIPFVHAETHAPDNQTISTMLNTQKILPLKNDNYYSQSTEYPAASAYIVVDLDTRSIITGKNIHSRLPVASLTKLMSAIVGTDLTIPEQRFTVDKMDTEVKPTKLGIQENEQLNTTELLQGMLLTSANDAASVLEHGVNKLYKRDIFISSMNNKAEILGLKDTHFTNAAGYDEDENYSSVYDMALLSDHILKNYPVIANIAAKTSMLLPHTRFHNAYYLQNWNGLLGVYPEIVGLKIGNTDKAGKTMIAVSNRNNRHIAVVILGVPEILQRDLIATQLLDKGYQSIGEKPVSITSHLLQQKYLNWKI